MSQPSTQSLRELIAKWRSRCASINPAIRSTTRILAAELEALLPALESALGERPVKLSRDEANIIASNTFNDAELGRIAEPAPAAPTERLRGPLSLEMVQGAIKQATTINPLHNYVRYIDEQKLRDILNDALTAHEAQAVAQARVDEAKWWQDYKDTNSDYKSAPIDPGPQRIADLERQVQDASR